MKATSFFVPVHSAHDKPWHRSGHYDKNSEFKLDRISILKWSVINWSEIVCCPAVTLNSVYDHFVNIPAFEHKYIHEHFYILSVTFIYPTRFTLTSSSPFPAQGGHHHSICWLSHLFLSLHLLNSNEKVMEAHQHFIHVIIKHKFTKPTEFEALHGVYYSGH